jgi:N-methylhydantoinase B/oxoprolinase/acetone carboxylase alpha subunit
VEFFNEKNANNFNEALISAAEEGHMELVEFVIEQGANGFMKAMKVMNQEGYKEFNRVLKQLA